MKNKKLYNHFIALFLVSGSISSYSQNWFENGAVWHYTHFSGGMLSGYIKITYEKDTVFSGHQWKKFSNIAQGIDISTTTPYYFQYTPLFFRDSLGIQYCETSTYSDTIYDFSRLVGDTLFYSGSTGCLRGIVASTDVVIINSFNLNYSVIDYSYCSSGTFSYRDTLVEFVGSINYFIHPFYNAEGFISSSPEPFGYFRCFSDSIFGSYSHYNYSMITACDWTMSFDQLEFSKQSFNISPNPTDNNFVLESTILNETFTLTDNLGKELRKNTINQSRTEVNVGDLPQGIYFVRCNNYVKKLVISR